MRSSFSGFSTAQLAMAASQRSLDVVGQNISNLNTPGYTRQRLDLQSISPTGHSYWNSLHSNKVGQGVMMTGVSQVRDPFLDIQYRNQLTDVGTVDATDKILSQMGDIFDETDRENIRNALNDVVSQLQNMSSAGNSGQDTSDNLVRSAMQILLNLFHDNAQAIKDTQGEIISELTGTVKQDIQTCIDSIVELNDAIKTSQVLGNPALELMDQRNSMIDALATYLPINVSYEKQHMGGDVYVDTLKITFKDANGNSHVLVDDGKAGKIDVTAVDDKPPVTVTVTGVDGKAVDVTDSLVDGVLKGNVDMLNKKGPFDKSDVKGIGYYEDYFNLFVNEFAQTLNKLNGPGNELFTTTNPDGVFTADNISISEGWLNGTISIKTTTQTGAGGSDNSSANDNVLKMINALTTEKKQFKKGDVVLFDGTFFDAYDNIQNTQAVERKGITSVLENRTTVLGQIANSKDSVSGVYLDEEVMNLMKYQQSYNAAARLMTTLDQALDTLINNTGVVGR